MLLCLDVGNTQIYGGIYNGKKFIHFFRFNTKQGWSSDQLGLHFKMFCNEHSIDSKKIEAVLVSSVVPSLDHHIKNASLKYFQKEAFFLKAGVKSGISLSKYKNPSEIGADLIASAVGVAKIYPQTNVLVVDMGTATTITAINSKKEFIGGVIIPGIQTQVDSITKSAEKLFAVEIKNPGKYTGTNTTHCLQTGIYYGHLHSVKGIVKNMAKECFGSSDFKVIGTGGFARLYETERLFDAFLADLVLIGLLEVYKLNC
jgi:type III pantothenate kinase